MAHICHSFAQSARVASRTRAIEAEHCIRAHRSVFAWRRTAIADLYVTL